MFSLRDFRSYMSPPPSAGVRQSLEVHLTHKEVKVLRDCWAHSETYNFENVGRRSSLCVFFLPTFSGQQIFHRIFDLEPEITKLFAKNDDDFRTSPAFYKHVRVFSNMLELVIEKVRIFLEHS